MASSLLSVLRMYDRKNWKYCHIFELGIFGYQHMRVIQNWEKKMGSPCLIFYQTTIKIHCFFTKSLKISTTSHPVKIHTVNEIFTFTLYKNKKNKSSKGNKSSIIFFKCLWNYNIYFLTKFATNIPNISGIGNCIW